VRLEFSRIAQQPRATSWPVSRRQAILHRFDFAQKLNIQTAHIIDPTAETPTDSRGALKAVNGLQSVTLSVSGASGFLPVSTALRLTSGSRNRV
jgi:hypothetical protein